MLTLALMPSALRILTRDGWLLFLTRFIRLFAYGSLSVVLVFYLIGLRVSETQTGILVPLTVVGDTVVSLYLTTRADRIGRRRMLIVGAILMAAAGFAFACTSNLLLLIVAGGHWRYKSKWQRSGAVSVDRTGRALSCFPRSEKDRGIRLVHARWFFGDRSRCTMWRGTHTRTRAKHVDACWQLPCRGHFLCRAGRAFGLLIYARFIRCRSQFASNRLRLSCDPEEFPRRRSVTPCSNQALEFVRSGLVCGRLRGAELRCLLVLPPFRCKPWDTRSRFLLGEYLCWNLRTSRLPPCISLRAHQHHRCHASPFEYFAHSCSPDAK